jgi:hypothetical protein
MHEVQVIPLDEILENVGVHSVSLIKIDVQGFQEEVINGMLELMNAWRPVLVFEYEKWAWDVSGSSLERVIEILDQLLYEYFAIAPDGGIKSITSDSVSNFGRLHLEILAVPAGKS